MGNWHGNGRPTTPRREMAAFDRLPPELRRRLSVALADWSAEDHLRLIRSGTPVARLLRDLDDADASGRYQHRRMNERLAVRVHRRPPAEAASATTQPRLL